MILVLRTASRTLLLDTYTTHSWLRARHKMCGQGKPAHPANGRIFSNKTLAFNLLDPVKSLLKTAFEAAHPRIRLGGVSRVLRGRTLTSRR